MSDAVTKFKRIVVISDLHLGGTGRVMMSRPDRLASFLGNLLRQVQSDERLELVIAGDFVDFLAIEPWSSWTPEPDLARQKLEHTMSGKPFGTVFDTLRDLVRAGCALTILLGNHDLELALPGVQEALWRRLSAGPHQVHFLTDGRAHRVGGLLIEHGNRYDGANANDWEYLRLISSAHSRAEPSPVALRTSFGSQFVIDHVNHLKAYYPFIDLIQPQNELVALLLLAFEPELIWDWKRICAGYKAQQLQGENPQGRQPGKICQIGASPLDKLDQELQSLFGSAYDQLRQPPQEVGKTELLRAYLDNRKDSLSEILGRGAAIPPERLMKIRVMLRRVLLDDASARLDGPTEQYGKAAERLLKTVEGVQAVIMGHTHLPRKVAVGGGLYINTGTWTDRICVPDNVLQKGTDKTLEAFLRDLLHNRRPDSRATFADARISPAGHVERIDLKEVHEHLSA